MRVRALLAVVVLVVGACGDDESASSVGEESADVATGPMIVAVEQEGYASGPLDGVLVLEDGCLYIDTGSNVGLAVFSHGSTCVAETSSVVHRLGTSVSVGDLLSGTAERHPVSDLVPWFVSEAELVRAQACAASTGINDAWIVGYFETGT